MFSRCGSRRQGRIRETRRAGIPRNRVRDVIQGIVELHKLDVNAGVAAVVVVVVTGLSSVRCTVQLRVTHSAVTCLGFRPRCHYVVVVVCVGILVIGVAVTTVLPLTYP